MKSVYIYTYMCVCVCVCVSRYKRTNANSNGNPDFLNILHGVFNGLMVGHGIEPRCLQ
jgi:hypothetical protein